MWMIFVWAGFLLLVLLGKSNFVKINVDIENKINPLVQLNFIQLKSIIAYFYWKFEKS